MRQKLLFLLCLILCCHIYGQHYPFVHYTPKDGLVNSRVRKAYQDSKGRMYFCTFGGLSVYDGARFKNYTTSNGLLHDMINDVLEVGNDSLLVAVNTGGLNVLVKGVMKRLDIRYQHDLIINNFLKTSEGIYLGADDGLYILRNKEIKKLSAFFPHTGKPVQFLGSLADYKDFLVFSTNDLRHKTGLFLYSKKLNKIMDVLPELIVYSLKKDRKNHLWIGAHSGLYNLDTSKLLAGKLQLTPTYIHNRKEFVTGGVSFNSQNDALVISNDQGIIRYSPKGTGETIFSALHFASTTESFFVDREDVIWICNNGNGVYKLPNSRLRPTNAFNNNKRSVIRRAKTLSPSLVCMITSDQRWVFANGIKTMSFTTSTVFDNEVYPLHIYEDHLYASSANHLYRAPWPQPDGSRLAFQKILTISPSSSFGGLAVTDPNGNMILFDKTNIYVMQNAKVIFRLSTSVYDLIQGMHIDKNGELWLITRALGLIVFSLHPEDPSAYLQKKKEFKDDFGAASPRTTLVDKNGMLWVGTRDHGLLGFEYLPDRLTKRFHYQTGNGLTDNFVTSLASDGANNILIGTQTGVDRLIKTGNGNYRLENITKSNNIFAFILHVWSDVTDKAFALANTGNVFFIEPPVLHTFEEPQLLIEGIKVNGADFPHSSSPLQLKYFQRNISFSVAAPTFLDEKQVKYTFFLSGNSNNAWTDTTASADINFLDLAPGNYTLTIKAFFPSTSYLPKEKIFHFKIHPPWWQTPAFQVLAFSLLGAFLILSVRFYYRRKLEKRTALLETQRAVDIERTRIATDMHDDLGAGLSRIKFLSETIGIKQQQKKPIDEEVNKIRIYSHQMIDTMGEIVWALNEKNDSLSDLLSYTRAYAMEYLSQNSIDCSVKMPENIGNSLIRGEFRRNVFLAVKEILHNIVKHANASKVDITIETGNFLMIRIRDNGIGFDPQNSRPMGNGLSNIEKRMTDIGGRSEITSRNGTVVELSAPFSSSLPYVSKTNSGTV